MNTFYQVKIHLTFFGISYEHLFPSINILTIETIYQLTFNNIKKSYEGWLMVFIWIFTQLNFLIPNKTGRWLHREKFQDTRL